MKKKIDAGDLEGFEHRFERLLAEIHWLQDLQAKGLLDKRIKRAVAWPRVISRQPKDPRYYMTVVSELNQRGLGEELVTIYTPAVQTRLNILSTLFQSKGIDPTTAGSYALTELNQSVQKQACLMAYGDSFFVIGVALLLSGISLFFLPKSQAMRARPPAAA